MLRRILLQSITAWNASSCAQSLLIASRIPHLVSSSKVGLGSFVVSNFEWEGVPGNILINHAGHAPVMILKVMPDSEAYHAGLMYV